MRQQHYNVEDVRIAVERSGQVEWNNNNVKRSHLLDGIDDLECGAAGTIGE